MCGDLIECPKCESTDIEELATYDEGGDEDHDFCCFECLECGKKFDALTIKIY